MIEFMGGDGLDSATCCFIAGCCDATDPDFNISTPDRLPVFLENQREVGRSLWDKNDLIADLDIDYVNFDFPAEPFLDQQRTFELQQPIRDAAEAVFNRLNLPVLHALTGRGQHFTWRIRSSSTAFHGVEGFGRLPTHMNQQYRSPHPPQGRIIGQPMAQAFAGLGLIMEYLAHLILAEAEQHSSIPIFPTAVESGTQQRGTEMVSIDISEYGDPLYTRAVCMPFSLYLKPLRDRHILHPKIEPRIADMAMVPTRGRSSSDMLQIMRNLGRAADWAGHVDCRIPDGSAGMARLARHYCNSRLRRFHDYFYSQEHNPPDQWPSTYDRFDTSSLPQDVQKTLAFPNEDLLKPVVIKRLVEVLMDRGWHPRHIAGLMRSKYERDYGWLNEWYVYDAATRADFYARLFSGLASGPCELSCNTDKACCKYPQEPIAAGDPT